jgi:transcriptional regulator with XRE-family HTH domain
VGFVTALATRPDHGLPVGETFDPTSARDETTRQEKVAAVSVVMRHVPEGRYRDEILDTLFADGDTRRKRAAEARARAKTGSAPVKQIVRKPSTLPMVPIGRAREHVADLTSRGMRQQAIARAAGVSDAAVSMLVRGAYKKGDAPRQEITPDLQKRILAVEFVAPTPRRLKPKPLRESRAAKPGRCRSAAEFKPAGDRIGQCLVCGEVARLCRGRLIGHATRQAGGAS